MSGLLRSTIRVASKAHSCRILSNLRTDVKSLQLIPARTIARWVAPSIKELNIRKKRYANKLPQVHKRSGFIDWNFDAEIYSFGQRLHENFDLNLLARAFTQRSYVLQEELRLGQLDVDQSDLAIPDNRDLAEKGLEISIKYVTAFLRYHLPKYPEEGILAIRDYLLSKDKLAYVSTNLGTKEIILAAEYPPSDDSLATTILAVVGALEQSENGGLERVHIFIRDFICTQLNQVDVNEIWEIKEPFELVKIVCAERNIPNVVARIIGEVGKGDILHGCHIGIYDADSKKLLGTGFGDSYPNGVDTASIDALSKLFGSYNLRPFDFTISSSKLFSRN